MYQNTRGTRGERSYRQAEEALFASAGITPSERWIVGRTLGTRLRVLEVGEGRPAVFLHGGPNAAATWAFVAAAARGLRCLLVDRPGCGLSDPPPFVPDGDTLADYVTTLTRDVLDAFGLERTALVGSSLGGYSALRSAISLPERVERVVLLGCPAFVPGWTKPTFFSLLRNPLTRRLLLAAPVTAPGVRWSLRQLGHERAVAAGAIPGPMLAWIRAWQRDTWTMRNDAAMIVACDRVGDRLDLTADELARVRARCLIVAATADPLGAEAVSRRIAAHLPEAQVDVMPGAGHLPWLDDPHAVGRRVASFVANELA